MCLHSLHSTERENRPINNRFDHRFELLFGCPRSRATVLFRLLQQSAYRRSRKWNMMVQLVQREWRIEREAEENAQHIPSVHSCFEPIKAQRRWEIHHERAEVFNSELFAFVCAFLFLENFAPELLSRRVAPLMRSLLHSSRLPNCHFAGLTEAKWQNHLRPGRSVSFRVWAAALLSHDTPVHLPWALCALLPFICVDVWRACSGPCVLAWKCVFGFLVLVLLIPDCSWCWYRPPWC